jgi:hypothetical protein
MSANEREGEPIATNLIIQSFELSLCSVVLSTFFSIIRRAATAALHPLCDLKKSSQWKLTDDLVYEEAKQGSYSSLCLGLLSPLVRFRMRLLKKERHVGQ